jgi:hypothetical protein
MMPDDFVQKMRLAGSAAVATNIWLVRTQSVVELFASGWQPSSAVLVILLVREIKNPNKKTSNQQKKRRCLSKNIQEIAHNSDVKIGVSDSSISVTLTIIRRNRSE